MLRKEPLGDGTVRVTFIVSSHLWVDHIALVGEFNDWHTASHPLQQSAGEADWHISVDLEAGRSYRFRYLLNGQEWINDDHADGYEPNRYGGTDSIVRT
jgi:1,4-alpha-glucan branching enzyme